MNKVLLQQALDALDPYKSTVTRAYTKVDASIDALRTELAKPEPVHGHYHPLLEKRAALKAAIEELIADAAMYQHIKRNAHVGSVKTMPPQYKVHYWHGFEDAREYPVLTTQYGKK